MTLALQSLVYSVIRIGIFNFLRLHIIIRKIELHGPYVPRRRLWFPVLQSKYHKRFIIWSTSVQCSWNFINILYMVTKIAWNIFRIWEFVGLCVSTVPIHAVKGITIWHVLQSHLVAVCVRRFSCSIIRSSRTVHKMNVFRNQPVVLDRIPPD